MSTEYQRPMGRSAVMRRRKPGSLRVWLAAAALVCWLLPIGIITVTAGALLRASYNDSLRQRINADASAAMDQTVLRMAGVIEDSKAVSYDGVVRQAYQAYQLDTVGFFVYRDTTSYLAQKFTRSSSYQAVFISFLDEELHAYASASGVSRQNLLRQYTEEVLPAARALLAQRNTGIYFMTDGGELYLVRNLLNQAFEPYAVLVMELEKETVFQSLAQIDGLLSPSLTVDGVPIPLEGDKADASAKEVLYTAEVDGHTLELAACIPADSPWSDVPLLRWAIAGVTALVIPLLALIVWLFRQYLDRPIAVMIDAAARIQAGERGYQITRAANSREFTLLYNHFNTMSAELESQFERSYQEQQALQEARIRALQSQINPHFLNNTLEVISWEARLADNERVCSMIEALSTMLSAATARDGRSTATLAEELKYVDAYLTITQERLGDRLTVTREIDPGVLDWRVMLLMLQPIVENAVEHDLSRAGGELCLRAYPRPGAEGTRLCVEVEHDGSTSPQDWENIRRALEPPGAPSGQSVGLRNVNQRLRLLYGESCRFDMTEIRPGRILARLELPGGAKSDRKEDTP